MPNILTLVAQEVETHERRRSQVSVSTHLGRRPESLLKLGELDSIIDPHDELSIEDDAGRQLIPRDGRDVEEWGGDVLSAT